MSELIKLDLDRNKTTSINPADISSITENSGYGYSIMISMLNGDKHSASDSYAFSVRDRLIQAGVM